MPVAYPYEFDCAACGLQLDVDELAEFDFPRSIELEREEDDWEPDEDFYSDR